MKILVGLSLLLFAGCATSYPTLDPVRQLARQIDTILSDSLLQTTLTCVKVTSLHSGQVLYDRNSRILVNPASNLKLLTSSASLQSLGEHFSFRTSVFADSVSKDSSVHGNLYLKGFGDPDLTVADLDTLAFRVHSMGVKTVAGDLVADESYFDDLSWGNGWMWDDEPDPDEMFISALSVNKNCVSITVSPTIIPSDSIVAQTNPPTHFITIKEDARTVGDSADYSLKISRLISEPPNTIEISGHIPTGVLSVQKRLSVRGPAMLAADLFRTSLEEDSIAVLGSTRLGDVPTTATQLVEHSRAIDSVIFGMNKMSDNLAAENLLKTMGAERFGLPGTAQKGVYVINQFLSSLGIDTASSCVVDGSGVSRYNLLSADNIVQLLAGIARRPDPFHVIYASLPIAGVDGTLESRMRGTRAEANVRAKTGTLNGVSSLSGYVTTRDGELLAFSMIMQNFVAPLGHFLSAQDRICELLAQFSRNGEITGSR